LALGAKDKKTPCNSAFSVSLWLICYSSFPELNSSNWGTSLPARRRERASRGRLNESQGLPLQTSHL